jgi:predicted type IV restriction endonuclease
MDMKGCCLMNKLELFLERLARDQVLFSSVEEAVRQAAVLPILSYLGWDTYNIMEVTPEYRVESGRVDYCLQYGTRKAAYIEVKRTLEDLEQHQKQLLEYAFTDGVELAALTNGHLWWLYLPLSGANWQQRRFFTIDIREQAPGDAAAHFRDFLSKETVGNGSALQRARTIHAGREKKRRVRDTIPKAWASLLLDSDEELLELLANKVEGMCDYLPATANRRVHD